MGTTNSVRGGRRVGEDARAREDPPVMGVEDAVVDTDGQAKVIGIDDKTSKHGYPPIDGTLESTARRRHGTPAMAPAVVEAARRRRGSRTSRDRPGQGPTPAGWAECLASTAIEREGPFDRWCAGSTPPRRARRSRQRPTVPPS